MIAQYVMTFIIINDNTSAETAWDGMAWDDPPNGWRESCAVLYCAVPVLHGTG
jgi:hypothetical protein